MTGRRAKWLEKADLGAIAFLPPSDPARDLIAEILRVVSVSHWSFARFRGNGPSDELLLPEGDNEGRRAEFDYLRAEFVLQRGRTPKGPSLSATLRSLEAPYMSGITLLFADNRTTFGILNLLRTGELGPFTSSEIQALALALDSAADRLAGLALTEAPSGSVPREGGAATLDAPSMHVLDQDLKVILTWNAAEQRTAAITSSHARLEDRLPPIIEAAVRDVISTWSSDPHAQVSAVRRPVPFLVVRVQPLEGPIGLFVGVLLERAPGSHVFMRAADTYALSPRELQTLALLLEGEPLDVIATSMHITPSTVQDHIKSMLAKTSSKNRSELLAKVLSPLHQED